MTGYGWFVDTLAVMLGMPTALMMVYFFMYTAAYSWSRGSFDGINAALRRQKCDKQEAELLLSRAMREESNPQTKSKED